MGSRYFHLKHLCHRHHCHKHFYCKYLHWIIDWLWGKCPVKDEITGWQVWFDTLVSTGWNVLAFLPVGDIINGFIELADLPQELISYFETQYIGGERGQGSGRCRVEPTFPTELGNVYQCACDNMPKTNNNHVEAFTTQRKAQLQRCL